MLSARDDFIGHPSSAPFDDEGGSPVARSTDPRFTERYWYTAHPIDGTPMLLDLGLGHYPNRGVMDAFAGITLGREQHNFRATRRLGERPLDTQLGPLRFEVIEPLKRHRLSLAENPSGLRFELDFEASFPLAQEKLSLRQRKGQIEEDMARSTQFGRWRGWIEAAGRRHVVEPALWWGQRDHSWGLRTPMLTDATHAPVHEVRQFFWTWAMCQFADCGISLFFKEREPGAPYYLSGTEFLRAADGSVQQRELKVVGHDYQWADDPLGQTLVSADLQLEFESGPARRLRLKTLPTRFYLKGGLYGGLGGWNHGDDRCSADGQVHAEHDVWQLNDAATRARARTLSDHVLEASLDGQDGAAGATGAASAIGHGIIEYGVAAGYARYLEAQKFPAL